MQTIHKFPFPTSDDEGVVHIAMPKDAKVLSVQTQGPWITLWAQVEDTNALETRRFALIGTGSRVWGDLTKADFIGTVQTGIFVWHIYQL